METPDALVVGAGAAGLAAALELRRAGVSVAVVDAGERPGGVMRSERVGPYLVERGPNTLLVRAPGLAVLRAAGAEAALEPATPAARLRFLFCGGKLEPVPMTPLAFARTPLLSARGKLRLLAEPWLRGGDPTGESVAEFAGRRLGHEAVSALVGPFLTGIYAGDERELGAEAVFPGLVALEREAGSIVRGALARALRRRRPEPGLRGTFSAREGLAGLAAALAHGLGPALALRTRVVALAREGGGGAGWRVETEGTGGARSWRVRAVVLAVSAADAATRLAPLDPEAAALASGIDYAPIVSASVAARPEEARRPVEGFGFLVPREADLAVLGCLFMSRLFPERAPADRVLLTSFLGGVRRRELAEAPDDRVWKLLSEDLERTLGLRGLEPLGLARWPRAVPQPGRDHPRRIAARRARLEALPGLALAGAWLDGVSVSDTLACGARAGRRLAAGLGAASALQSGNGSADQPRRG